MGTQVLYADNFQEIPSEFIEPYLQRFLMSGLEGIAYGITDPQTFKDQLHSLESFVDMFCGIHSRYAMTNERRRIRRLSNDELIQIAKATFNI